jgi:SAM-dependent methyltransferase
VPFTAAELAAGVHREQVGGLWEELGELQLAFLVRQGLQPSMRLLDLGCGSLRAGVRLVEYLAPGNYYGIDSRASLLAAGYDFELAARGLQPRLPPGNLLHDASFAVHRFGVRFHVAIAISLFTHLPETRVRSCLAALARVMEPAGVLYATFFACPPRHRSGEPLVHEPGGITTYDDRDPYHYRQRDLAACAEGLPWRAEPLGDWGHPRGQQMMRFAISG